MKLSVLLALVVTVARWSVNAVELSCEPVELESPEPLCQPVTSPEDCVEVEEQGNSKPGCYLEPDCPANKLNYSRVVVDEDNSYSITGLPNFDDSSHIGYCPEKPDDTWDTGGCLPMYNAQGYHVGELSMRFSPVDTFHYKITVSWNYPPFPWPEGAVFRLLVKTVEARPEHYYCVCINGTLRLTKHSLIVKYHPVTIRDFVEASIVTFPHRSSSERLRDSSEIYQSDNVPVSCADTKNIHYSRSRCAIPHHGKPRNVKLNVIGTVTRLSWDKPCYQHPNACRLLEMDSSGSRSDPDTYYLTATVNNITHYFIIYNTTAVVLHTTHLQDFKLYTQTPCSKRYHPFANGCSEPATLNDTNNDTCCRTQPTTAVTPIPSVTNTPSTEGPTVTQSTIVKSESRTGLNGVIAAVVVVGVLISAAGLVVLIVLLVYSRYCRRRGPPVVTDILSTSPSPDLYPPPPSSTLLSETPPSVLVVFSPRTNHEESQVIRQCLIDDLADCNIEASAYGMYEMRQSPTEWIVEQQKKANAVLCVCNREFFEDWSSPSLDHNPKVVLTLKQLFQGDLQKGSSGVEPYAVIKMRPTDSQYIPPLLKSRPSYMYNQTKDIAHFAHNKPIYA